jgi:hypothetical protein
VKLDNVKFARKIRFLYIIVPFIISLALALLYLAVRVESIWWLLGALIVLVPFFIILEKKQYRFIVFYAEADKVIVNYKRLEPFPTLNNKVEIKTAWFHGYEIVNEDKPGKEKLILIQKTANGIAQYKPISLSALETDQIQKIKKALELVMAIKDQSGQK